MANRLLTAELPGPSRGVPDGIRLAIAERRDADQIGALYLEAYGSRVEDATLSESIDDIVWSFDGGYGVLFEQASLVAWRAERVVGALLTVWDAPWPEVPHGPFIIDLFVETGERGRGVGGALAASAMAAAHEAGAEQLAARVALDNTPAIALYSSLGFMPRDDA